MNEHLHNDSQPSQTLSLIDTVAIVIGIVLGAGIFVFPSLVASNLDSTRVLLLAWVAGGIFSFIGALCYAELATTYPHAGGDYHFLQGAYGRSVSFMFAWARMMVIQPGSIVMISFVIGEELTTYFPVGQYSASIYAALIVLFLTAINIAGIREGKWTQKLLTSAILLGLLVLIGIGFSAEAVPSETADPDIGPAKTMAGLGMAMIFILLTYSGWNESAYVSAEIKNPEKNIIKALLIGIGTITFIYVVVNYTFCRALGIEQMAEHSAPQRLIEVTLGSSFVPFISIILILAALSTTNATIITGARSNYALGRNFKLFSFLGRWRGRTNTPARGLMFQALISMVLVLIGTVFSKRGLEAMVDYTAPAFWFFFLLVGVSLFVYRKWDNMKHRPFKVPLYPLTPLLFVIVCVYMLQCSLSYTGRGAMVSVLVLIAAIPVMALNKWLQRRPAG